MRYVIKYPRNGRISFAVIRQTEFPDGSTKNETISTPEIDALNSAYKAGNITYEVGKKNLKEIVRALSGTPPVVHNTDNESLVERYWDMEYSHRELVDRDTAKQELFRSVRYLGNTSLISASQKQIQAALDKNNLKPSIQRRAVGKLISLLRFIERYDIKLRKDKEPKNKVSFITEAEMLDLPLENTVHTLIKTLYYTGMRIGEALAVDYEQIRNGYILVDRQIDKHGRIREPKWGSTRRTYVKEKHLIYIKDWIKMRSTIQLDRTTLDKYLRQAGARQLKKHISFNTLRHSYAIRLLGQGASFAEVAMCLGNSEKVCREYYIGYEMSDEGIENLRRRLGA